MVGMDMRLSVLQGILINRFNLTLMRNRVSRISNSRNDVVIYRLIGEETDQSRKECKVR